MSGKGISKLALPDDAFNPALSTERKGAIIKFETLDECIREDELRVGKVKKSASDHYDDWGYQRVPSHDGLHDPLSRKLLLGIDGDPQPSLASRVYMRDRRIAVAGGLWSLHAQHGFEERFFNIMPRCWEIPADGLARWKAQAMMKAFRAQLLHAGAGYANGYVFCAIDGEFVDFCNTWRLSVQGIATGEMIDVVDGLRHCRKFKPTGVTKEGKRRTVVQLREVYNRSSPYTYCLKSLWNVRSFFDEDKGKEVRLNMGNYRRIPDPHLAELLIWLDRWRLEDLSLMVHLRVTDEGLEYRPPKSART